MSNQDKITLDHKEKFGKVTGGTGHHMLITPLATTVLKSLAIIHFLNIIKKCV